MFKMFIVFYKFFKSLILQILWIHDFLWFYELFGVWVVVWLYGFPHFFNLGLAEELRKNKFLIVQGIFVRLLILHGRCNTIAIQMEDVRIKLLANRKTRKEILT